MTKAEIVRKVRLRAPVRLSREQVTWLIDAIFAEIGRAVVKSGRFTYPRFGTFVVRKRRERAGRNPITKAAMVVPAGTSIGVRPAPEMKKALASTIERER